MYKGNTKQLGGYTGMALQWSRNGDFTAYIFSWRIQPHLLNRYEICIADEFENR